MNAKRILQSLTVALFLVCQTALPATFTPAWPESIVGMQWDGSTGQVYREDPINKSHWQATVPSGTRYRGYPTVSTQWFWMSWPNGLYGCKRPCSFDGNGYLRWDVIDRSLVLQEIDADDAELWGVSAAGGIYKRKVDGTDSWTKVPGGLSWVSTSPTQVWGVNSASEIWHCAQPCSGNFVRVEGGLVQLDVKAGFVWGTNSGGDVYKRRSDASGPWILVRKGLRRVSPGTSWVWGIDFYNRNVVKCRQPCESNSVWITVNGQLDGIDAL